jgi:hypothetical protein
VSPRKKSVHLFSGHTLIATRLTDRHRPAEFYVVAGLTYDVTNFQSSTDDDGAAAFTAQVTLRA